LTSEAPHKRPEAPELTSGDHNLVGSQVASCSYSLINGFVSPKLIQLEIKKTENQKTEGTV
jgi:hypothetical protein